MIRDKKILFLTTNNLATNPRLVKEMKLARENGFRVEAICFDFKNWSHGLNEELKKHLSDIKIHTIQAGRRPIIKWFTNALTEKSYRLLLKIFPLGIRALSQAVSRRSNMLIDALKNIEGADLVVGHNPGALLPTFFAGKKFNCRVGFDMEDYHPGEGTNKHQQELTCSLMQKILPLMDYVSFASPLIMKETQRDTHSEAKNWVSVLNYFPAEDFIEPVKFTKGPLKLVWFSQNINEGRGLELILPFIKQSQENIELHLIGNMNNAFYDMYVKESSNIFVHAPLPQKGLHYSLALYDIGLAIEPSKDLNNELAISNKILAYLQSGLYVVATNTPAQKDFLKDFPDHGFCFNYLENNFATILMEIVKNKESIRSNKLSRFQNFQNKNWSNEAEKLLVKWNVI